jgi:hypothetical protein
VAHREKRDDDDGGMKKENFHNQTAKARKSFMISLSHSYSMLLFDFEKHFAFITHKILLFYNIATKSAYLLSRATAVCFDIASVIVRM